MGVLDQINQMKAQGMDDNSIIQNLQQQGVSPAEIQNAMAQMQVKSAVAGEQVPAELQEMQTPQMPQQEMQAQEYAPQDQQQYYEQYPQQYAMQPDSTDNTIEIAQQVVNEKTSKMQTSLNSLKETQELSKHQLENLNKRLENIESIIDKLQITILEKVGSYGQNINAIKKEMSMMQNSFAKVVNKATGKPVAVKKSTTKKKSRK